MKKHDKTKKHSKSAVARPQAGAQAEPQIDTEAKLRRLVAQHGLARVFEHYGPTARRLWRCCQLYTILNGAIDHAPVLALRAWSQAALLQVVGVGIIESTSAALGLTGLAHDKINAALHAGQLNAKQHDFAIASVDTLHQILIFRQLGSMISSGQELSDRCLAGLKQAVSQLKELRCRFATSLNPVLPDEFDMWRFQEVGQEGETDQDQQLYYFPGRLYDDHLLHFALDSLAGAITRNKIDDTEAGTQADAVAREMIALVPDSSRGYYWRYKAASLCNIAMVKQLEPLSAAIDRLPDDQSEKRALFTYMLLSLYMYDPRVLTREFRHYFKRIRGIEKTTLYPLGLDVPRTVQPVIMVRAAIKALKPGEDDKPLILKLLNDGFVPPMPYAPVCGHCRNYFLRLNTCTRCRSVKYCSRACQKEAWPQHKHVCKASSKPY